MWFRRIITFAGLAFVLTVAIWAELNEHPYIGHDHQNQQSAADQIGHPGEPAILFLERLGSAVEWTEAHHDFVIAIGTVFLALFTFALFAATWGLVLLGKRQSGDMRQLIGAAQNNVTATDSLAHIAREQHAALQEQARATTAVAAAAAKSADIAERTLVEFEAPFIYVKVVRPGLTIKKRDDSSLQADFGFGSFLFSNYGRTSARIVSYYETIVTTDYGLMPEPIDVLSVEENSLPEGIVVLPNGGDSAEYQFNPMFAAFRGFDPAKEEMFFVGFVRYMDLLGNRYISGFCFVFFASQNIFVLVGGDPYNYRRRDDVAALNPPQV